jgi:ABC-type uncharacterized transport system substrate-binding protein
MVGSPVNHEASYGDVLFLGLYGRTTQNQILCRIQKPPLLDLKIIRQYFFIMIRRLLFFALSCIGLMAGQLVAHPHVFVEPKAKLICAGRQLLRVEVEFQFDLMTSRGIIEAFDQNKNGRLDAHEIAVIRTKAIPGLAEYGFFTYLRLDGVAIQVRGTGADVRVHPNGKVSYLFVIPVGRTVAREVRFWFSDPTIFTAFDTKRANMILISAPAGASLGESRDPDALRIIARL